MDNTAQSSSSSLSYQVTPSTLLGRVRGGFSGNIQTSQAKSDQAFDKIVGQPIISNAQLSDQDYIQADVSTAEKLKTLEEVLDEVEARRIAVSGMLAQAMPQAVTEVVSSQQTQRGSTLKEAQELQIFESIPGTSIEYEAEVEISPEVEAFVQKVEKQDQLPQEIAINANDINLSQPKRLAKKAVVVLPITLEIEETGEKKSSKYSIRWLVEFAKKIMKMFNGEVIYKDVRF